MPALRVWISINPPICMHLFIRIFESLGIEEINILGSKIQSDSLLASRTGTDDLLLLSLNRNDRLENTWALEKLPNARVVAFSPNGDYALLRNSEPRGWEAVRPYGLQQLLDDMFNVWRSDRNTLSN